MSDEGEDLAGIQSVLDSRFENKRLIQSSNEFRRKMETIEKRIGDKNGGRTAPKHETFIGCRITKAMKQMDITESEFDLLNDFLFSILNLSEAQNSWILALSQKLSPKKARKSEIISTKAADKLVKKRKAELENTAFRLITLEMVMKLHTTRAGSSLTWFIGLTPQLKTRKRDFLALFNDCVQSSMEDLEEIIEDRGLNYCVEEYLIKHFKEKVTE